MPAAPNNDDAAMDAFILAQININLGYAKSLILQCNKPNKRNLLLKMLNIAEQRFNKSKTSETLDSCWLASVKIVEILLEQMDSEDFVFDFNFDEK